MVHYRQSNKQGNTIKFETEAIQSSLYDYSDKFVLLRESITVTAKDDTMLRLKIVHHFIHEKQ